jgi:hypothetical protein
MGHTPESFSEDEFLQQVLGGLETTAGVEPSETCGVEGVPGDGDPSLSTSVKPKKKVVGPRKKQVRFRFRVANTGDGAASSLRLCAKAPKRKVKVKGKACRPVASLAAGAAATKAFKVKPKPALRGRKARIRFIANGPGVAKKRAVAVLKVRK